MISNLVKSSIFMNMPVLPTNLTQTVDLPYFCVNEYNLSIMQKISEIITNHHFMPFKLKTKKNAQIYTPYYVCNTPHTDHAFYYLQSIRPISTLLLEHTAFSISQSVKAVYIRHMLIWVTLRMVLLIQFFYKMNNMFMT